MELWVNIHNVRSKREFLASLGRVPVVGEVILTDERDWLVVVGVIHCPRGVAKGGYLAEVHVKPMDERLLPWA